MSSRASAMLLHTRVPTSMTEVCISALTRSSRRSLPWASISVSMCERRSRVTGSMTWYSSSMPSENEGRMLAPGTTEGIVRQGGSYDQGTAGELGAADGRVCKGNSVCLVNLPRFELMFEPLHIHSAADERDALKLESRTLLVRGCSAQPDF